MEFSLLHAGLAAGAALAVVPLIIHLAMRQPPRRIIFPALRLVQQRYRQSTRRLKVKNWLLLLARMALLALMALALARPALHSSVTLGDREVPTALGLVFDTSPSMGYAEAGKTRLDEAKERAETILKRLPESSQIYLIDSADPGVPAAVSPSAARSRIASLAVRPITRPLNVAVGRAYEAIAQSDRPRHEVYVLTDLARSAWDTERPVEGLEKAKAIKLGVATYVLRLAPKEPRDLAIIAAEAGPSAEVDPGQGDVFAIKATLRAAGKAATPVVEFFLDGTKRDQAQVELAAGGEASHTFKTPPNLATGLHQGELRIASADPLPFDDRRFVTFEVRPTAKVLIVFDPAASSEARTVDAEFVARALDPYGFGKPHQVETLATNSRPSLEAGFPKPLRGFACVVVNNVTALPEACWQQILAYVSDGGGLVVGLGPRSDPASYNGPTAARILPAELGRAVAPAGGTAIGQGDFTHPILGRYPRDLAADLAGVPVRRYWSTKPREKARTLLSYQDGGAALLERDLAGGTRIGRVLLWTTPLSRRSRSADPSAWNELPQFWSFVELMDQTVPYLAGGAGQRLNYDAGEDAYLPIEPGAGHTAFVVQGPGERRSDSLTPNAGAATLVVEQPQPTGNWRVVGSGPGVADASLGFSLNPRADESSFATLDEAALNALFGGKDRYKLADSPEGLARATREARIGRELFPWIMALILALVTAENFLANRFHREHASSAAAITGTARAPAPAAA